jgi:chromosomal replication initiation ATPase DnaA
MERQRRLGKLPPSGASCPGQARLPSPSSFSSQPSSSPARAIELLQAEVAQLSAKLQAVKRADETPLVTPSRIKPVMNTVAKHYRVLLRDLASYRRAPELVRARQVAMYVAREITRHSLSKIGRVLDRDHTTVLHGCRRIAELRGEDPQLDAEIRALIEKLTPGKTDGT